jgi:aromatic ring-opening dioxygenase catalytic subunit (LigB family)
MTTEKAQLPTMFIGHGGGPRPLIKEDTHAALLQTWVPGSPAHTILHDPRIEAIIVISGHYESSDRSVHIMADDSPGLLFDYYGFPPETYAYTIANPGSPDLAARVATLLSNSGIESRMEIHRGHDHGTFVPLMGLEVTKLRADIPIVSISLRGPADYRFGEPTLTSDHWAMGQALAPLRNENVLILGSGNTHHGRSTQEESKDFDVHLRLLGTKGASNLRCWAIHPAAYKCHPRPEHLLPLIVCAGSASDSIQIESVPHDLMGNACSHFIFH